MEERDGQTNKNGGRKKARKVNGWTNRMEGRNGTFVVKGVVVGVVNSRDSVFIRRSVLKAWGRGEGRWGKGDYFESKC
jgi:hypothetical protein